MSRTPSTITLVSKEDRALAAYAGNFRKNLPEYRAVLRQASRGQTVDLASLRGALFGAMRCATTSNGQSMGRRKDAEQIERLWNRLPGSLAEVATTPQTLTPVNAEVAEALSAARVEIEKLREALERQAAALVEQTNNRNRLTDEVIGLQRANSEKQAALSYASGLLDDGAVNLLDGFIDGWNAARA